VTGLSSTRQHVEPQPQVLLVASPCFLFAPNALPPSPIAWAARVGTLTAGREWLKLWRTIAGETLADAHQPALIGSLIAEPPHEHEPEPAYVAPELLLDHPLRDRDGAIGCDSLIPAVGTPAFVSLGQHAVGHRTVLSLVIVGASGATGPLERRSTQDGTP
jgi:hypothetical protein